MSGHAEFFGLFHSLPRALCEVVASGQFGAANPAWSKCYATGPPVDLSHAYNLARQSGDGGRVSFERTTCDGRRVNVTAHVFAVAASGQVLALVEHESPTEDSSDGASILDHVADAPITCLWLGPDAEVTRTLGHGLSLAGIDLELGSGLRGLGAWDLDFDDWWPEVMSGEPCQLTLTCGETWFDVWVAPRSRQGAIIGAYAILFDSSIHHLAGQAMQATEELLRGVLTSMPLVLVAINQQRRVLLLEGAQARAYGLAPGEGVGQLSGEVFADTPKVIESLDQALAGTANNLIAEVGTQFFKIWSAPFYDDAGEKSGAIAVAADITARMHNEKMLLQQGDQLRVARDQALAASRAKTEFLAVMSHELRTPLNAIIGYSEMLFDEAEGEVRADLSRVLSAAHHLLTLISDVLELSRIEAGRSRVERRRFSLAHVVERSVAHAKQRNPDSKVEIRHPPLEGLGEMVSDRSKVGQILDNLLDNALKFTPVGEVRLEIDTLVEDVRQVVLTVTDTGIGMDEDTLAQLFTAFYQADSSTTRRYGGTGMGLTITERFCRLLGGKIEVSSSIGDGSSFRVVLPRELAVG